MNGNFFIGMAVGAVAGMILLDGSSDVKRMFKKGKQMATEQVSSLTNGMNANQNSKPSSQSSSIGQNS